MATVMPAVEVVLLPLVAPMPILCGDVGGDACCGSGVAGYVRVHDQDWRYRLGSKHPCSGGIDVLPVSPAIQELQSDSRGRIKHTSNSGTHYGTFAYQSRCYFKLWHMVLALCISLLAYGI